MFKTTLSSLIINDIVSTYDSFRLAVSYHDLSFDEYLIIINCANCSGNCNIDSLFSQSISPITYNLEDIKLKRLKLFCCILIWLLCQLSYLVAT